MTNRAMIAMLFMLQAACGLVDDQASGNVVNRREAKYPGLADLPHISKGGIDFPYMRYSETTGRVESRGQLFYLYPTARPKNGLVALEYKPGSRVGLLDVEEILGSVGEVVVEDRRVRVDFMPISLPPGVSAGQKWPMRYADRDFSCAGEAASGTDAGSGEIEVSCSAEKYVLRFSFNREQGVTQYQDFCGNSVCTYRLDEPLGLLSSVTLEDMGLPPI